MIKFNSTDAEIPHLIQAAKMYKKSQEEIRFRRNHWDSFKSLASQLTQYIYSNYDLPIQFDQNCDFYAHEFVSMEFKKQRSGITRYLKESTIEEEGVLYKVGGKLTFTQTYNGKILVIYEYPYVDELIDKVDPVIMESYEPTALEQNKLFDIVTDFINLITEWEEKAHVPKQFRPLQKELSARS